MNEQLPELFRKIIILNELGGNMKYVLQFSDADGVRSGKSGWSFGVVQFDLSNNVLAAACLRECEFTENEIHGLITQSIDPKPLEQKLRDHADVVERYDQHQLEGCLDRATELLEGAGITPSDDTAFLAVADMANQYSPRTVDKLIAHLGTLGQPFKAIDVLDFKLEHTPYGQAHDGDCKRRYMNVLKVVQNEG
jgi:hypothetical protein